ncbi:hypothetical protein L484_002165 [Morus notabilis]|uniref:Uncharacterized protein n=1 Tax=Morus notabilis TaxID=981085 RepID=W9SDD3_9ROSA|nr:hypothetical protein L484_002165 [Morus notabilis]
MTTYSNGGVIGRELGVVNFIERSHLCMNYSLCLSEETTETTEGIRGSEKGYQALILHGQKVTARAVLKRLLERVEGTIKLDHSLSVSSHIWPQEGPLWLANPETTLLSFVFLLPYPLSQYLLSLMVMLVVELLTDRFHPDFNIPIRSSVLALTMHCMTLSLLSFNTYVMGDRDVMEYYNEMTALWQELDLCYDEEWDCAKDSVRYLKRMEND